jgi:pyruvate kinase
VKSAFAKTTDEMILKGEALLKQQGMVQTGDTIVMLGGQSHTAGATNMLRVHAIS